jgi:ketosteroid isomerase-like protein
MAGRLFDRFVIRFPRAAVLATRLVLALPFARLRLALVGQALRLAYGSLERGTALTLFAVFLTPDVEWTLPAPIPDVPDRRLHGRDAVAKWYGEFSTGINPRTMPVEIEEHERGVFVVHAVTHVRVAASGLEAEMHDIDELHFRRGRIVGWHEELDESSGTFWHGLLSGTGPSF